MNGFGATASYQQGEVPPRLPVDADIPPGIPTQLPGGVWAARNPINFPEQQQDQRDQEFQRALLQNVRVQDAAKAVEAAMRFQGMRGYERDLAMAKSAGLSDEQAATHALIRNSPKMFFNNPQAMAAVRPVPEPRAMTIPGLGTVGVSGRDQRIQYPPSSTTGMPAAEKYLNLADQEEAAAEQSRSAGNTAAYQSHKERADLYRTQAQPRTSTTEVSFDASGRPVVSATTGPKPTIAATTRAQETTVKYENATTLLNQLQKSLRPEDVGVAGLGGEMILDRTVAQFYPQFANRDRIENRTALAALRESLLRQMSDDPRFSNLDRKVVTDMLPSTGAFESYEDAQARMARVRSILADRARSYATSTRSPIPDFAKSRSELTGEYEATLKQLKDAVNANRMTPEQAVQQAKRLHEALLSSLERYH